MSSSSVTPPVSGAAAAGRLLLSRLLYVTILFVLLGAVLFVSAGRLDWADAWWFLDIYYLVSLAGATWLVIIDPSLARERALPKKNTKSWDGVIVALNVLLTLALLAVTGLDAGRFGWSHVPIAARALGLLGFIPAFALPLWASWVNTYLSGTVRIQEERGHQVVSSGPYRYVRHPMYAGMIVYDLSLPPLLGSWWGLVVSAAMILNLVIRTVLEDRTLQRELPGYAEYARQVPFRLIPGVW